MKNLIRLFPLLILLLIPTTIQAQTITKTLSYDFNDSLINVNSYVHSWKIDSAAPIQQTVTCAVNGAVVTCQGPITITNVPHTIVVTVTNAGGSASGTLNYVPPASPASPTNIKIIVNITVP